MAGDRFMSFEEDLAASVKRMMREYEGLSLEEKRAAMQRRLSETQAEIIATQRRTLANLRAQMAVTGEQGADDPTMAAFQRLMDRTERALSKSLEEQATLSRRTE